MKQTRVKSHPLSKIVRRVIEHSSYRKALAVNAIAFAVVFNATIYPSHAFDYSTTSTSVLGQMGSEVVRTESKYVFPVINPTAISQNYHRFHPGVDIRAPKGHSVVSVASGIVIEVEYLKGGYGRHVRIAHAGTVSTLYAHLDQVKVVVGQKVTKGEEIGTIGTTGWSTGPHLHFEITEGTSTINPKLALTI